MRKIKTTYFNGIEWIINHCPVSCVTDKFRIIECTFNLRVNFFLYNIFVIYLLFLVKYCSVMMFLKNRIHLYFMSWGRILNGVWIPSSRTENPFSPVWVLYPEYTNVIRVRTVLTFGNCSYAWWYDYFILTI